MQLAKLLAVQSLKWAFIPPTLHAKIRLLISLRRQKRERKAPTLGDFNLGFKAHFGRASLPVSVGVTQAPR